MKRLILILISICLLVIDNTILPYYSINGVFPSLLFVFAIAYSIICGSEEAIFIGIVSGFLQDIFFFKGFGVNLLLNMLLCVLAAKVGKNIFKENRLIPIATALGISILKVLGVAIIFKIFSLSIDLRSALLSSIMNSICMMLFYKLILTTLDKYIARDTWRF